MGYVPAGSFPQEGQGAHLPRRERGRGRTPRARAAQRRQVGNAGEAVAAGFLRRRGCDVLARNIRVGRGEIDLIVRDGADLVAVEVKAGADPLLHFTEAKADAVRTAMRRLDPSPVRLDLVTVTIGRNGARVRWYRGFG